MSRILVGSEQEQAITMGRIPDRAKQRREYLKKKRGIYGKIALSGAGMLALLTTICWIVDKTFTDPEFIHSRGINAVFVNLFLVGMVLYALAILAVMICFNGYSILDKAQEAAHLSYIPPVTPDTLPAEEVLVRGSVEPSTNQRKILVRPAATSEAMDAEQLLRSSQEQG